MLRFLLPVLFLLGAASAASARPQHGDFLLQQEAFLLPAGEHMQLASFATGSTEELHLLWVEVPEAIEEGASAAPTLRTAQWIDQAWTKPQTLASGPQLVLNWADTPRMAVSANGTAVLTWLESLPTNEGQSSSGYGIRYRWRGASDAPWSESAWLHEDLQSREHGFVSLMTLPDGSIQAAFLQAGATLEDPTMLRSVVIHADGTKSAERVLDERVCDCCDTAGVVLPNGKSMVIYRNRSDEEVRDIQYVREDPLAPEGEQPEVFALGADQWMIKGCPVNGPAITNQGRFVMTAWYTQFQGKLPQVKAVLSRSGGSKFALPTILAGGKNTIGRVEAAYFPEGEVAVAWLERSEEGKAQWVLRKIPTKGQPGPKRVLGAVPESRNSGFLSLRSSADGVLAVWRDAKAKQGLQIQRLWLQEKAD